MWRLLAIKLPKLVSKYPGAVQDKADLASGSEPTDEHQYPGKAESGQGIDDLSGIPRIRDFPYQWGENRQRNGESWKAEP
jgi:hypothetical protein